jgi:hypothetical protein
LQVPLVPERCRSALLRCRSNLPLAGTNRRRTAILIAEFSRSGTQPTIAC